MRSYYVSCGLVFVVLVWIGWLYSPSPSPTPFSPLSSTHASIEGFNLSDRELTLLRGKRASETTPPVTSRNQPDEVEPTDLLSFISDFGHV